MRALIVLGVSLALAACATPCPTPVDAPPRVAEFTCENDVAFTATITREQALVRQAGYPDAALPALSAGAGFRYGGDGIELRGRLDEARLSRPGGGELRCRAVRITSEISQSRSASVQPGLATSRTQTCAMN